MSYRLSSKKRQQRKNFWLNSVIGLFVFGIALGLFLLLGGTFTTIGSQVVSTTNGAKDVLVGSTINKQDLISDNNALQQELHEVRANNVAFDALVTRNQDLLRLLGRDQETKKVVAGVIKKPPFSPYDIYTIDAGTLNEVSVGDLALFSDFIALGIVTRANEVGSKITLFSAPQKVTRMNLGGQSFEVVGQGGGTLRMDVPRGLEVSVGDSLTLPGYNLYVTGIVQEIAFKPQDSLKKVYVKTPVNIERVDTVVTVPYTIQIQNETTEISNTQ